MLIFKRRRQNKLFLSIPVCDIIIFTLPLVSWVEWNYCNLLKKIPILWNVVVHSFWTQRKANKWNPDQIFLRIVSNSTSFGYTCLDNQSDESCDMKLVEKKMICKSKQSLFCKALLVAVLFTMTMVSSHIYRHRCFCIENLIHTFIYSHFI